MMWWFKKREVEDYSYLVETDLWRIRKYWSDEEAEFAYKLDHAYLVTNKRTGEARIDKSYNQGERNHDGEGWETVAYGDVAWARKTAAHYGILVPKEQGAIK